MRLAPMAARDRRLNGFPRQSCGEVASDPGRAMKRDRVQPERLCRRPAGTKRGRAGAPGECALAARRSADGEGGASPGRGSGETIPRRLRDRPALRWAKRLPRALRHVHRSRSVARQESLRRRGPVAGAACPRIRLPLRACSARTGRHSPGQSPPPRTRPSRGGGDGNRKRLRAHQRPSRAPPRRPNASSGRRSRRASPAHG
mmetsp:Transcript_4422/g.18779  ORF Transcript_4422/g.18779 Transcript_4422/m.18779 type:complete len:202 (-) Transcript_4422:526-1131(-)